MITLDGVEYLSAAEAAERLGADVTAAMVRQWAHRYPDMLQGYRVGRTTYYLEPQLVEVEHHTRTSGRGRRRRVA